MQSFSHSLSVWARIGLLSFGGPAAQIALMHRHVVEEEGWLSEQEFLNALAFCMLLPGPEAMQLATYAGWKHQGLWGGLAAGLLFVIPGALVILALGWAYLYWGDVPLMQAAFLGIKAAVLIIVFQALWRVAGKGLRSPLHWALSFASFLALFLFGVPFPLVILLAAAIGFLTAAPVTESNPVVLTVRPMQTVRTILVWLAIWIVPLLVIDLLSTGALMRDLALFFSKLAVVTFGGAYAVLAYMAQDAVEAQGWLSAAEMMDGLGLAETTPGPLILVTEFVGFLGAARDGGTLDPWRGSLGAFVTLWATFAPCFLWVFAGAPYIDWLGSQKRLAAAMAAISAAVVGVILNLSVWFSLHVLFSQLLEQKWAGLTVEVPQWTSLDLRVVGLATIAALGLLVVKRSVLEVLALCAALGVGLSLL